MQVVEDYCWAITRERGRSCSDQSGFCVLEFDRNWIPFYIRTRELPMAEIFMGLSLFPVRCGSEKSAAHGLLTLLLDLPFPGKYF